MVIQWQLCLGFLVLGNIPQVNHSHSQMPPTERERKKKAASNFIARKMFCSVASIKHSIFFPSCFCWWREWLSVLFTWTSDFSGAGSSQDGLPKWNEWRVWFYLKLWLSPKCWLVGDSSATKKLNKMTNRLTTVYC